MSGPCEQCAHFRPERQPSELLNLGIEERTASAFEQNLDAQERLRDSEGRVKSSLMQSGSERWFMRPQVLSYCGLREDEGVFLLCEMKNPRQSCGDFTPVENAVHRPCETCCHMVRPGGPQRDHVNLMDFIDPSLNSYNNGFAEGPQSTRTDVSSNVDKLIGISQMNRSIEMNLAMAGHGTMATVPQYYAYCRKYSSHGKYVLCSTQNPEGRCPGWSDGAGGQGSDQSAWGGAWL